MILKRILIFLIEEYVKIRKELFLEIDPSEKSIENKESKGNRTTSHTAENQINNENTSNIDQ